MKALMLILFVAAPLMAQETPRSSAVSEQQVCSRGKTTRP
jgi:hypothetical protein